MVTLARNISPKKTTQGCYKASINLYDEGGELHFSDNRSAFPIASWHSLRNLLYIYISESDDFVRTQSALKANPNYLPPQIHGFSKGTSPAKQEPRVAKSSLCKIWISTGEISQTLSIGFNFLKYILVLCRWNQTGVHPVSTPGPSRWEVCCKLWPTEDQNSYQRKDLSGYEVQKQVCRGPGWRQLQGICQRWQGCEPGNGRGNESY